MIRIISKKRKTIILIAVAVVLAIVATKGGVWLYEDIRFKNDQNYIPAWLEEKVWNLIDFPESEMLPVEKIRELFPLPEDESERTALCDELIKMFMERVNPKYDIYKWFDQNDNPDYPSQSRRYWTYSSNNSEKVEAKYMGERGLMAIHQQKDDPREGYISFTWLMDDFTVIYCYRTDGSAVKTHLATKSGMVGGIIVTHLDGSTSKAYDLRFFAEDRPVALRFDTLKGAIALTKNMGSFEPFNVIGEISVEDFSAYRRAQASGEVSKHTTLKQIQKFIEKTKEK